MLHPEKYHTFDLYDIEFDDNGEAVLPFPEFRFTLIFRKYFPEEGKNFKIVMSLRQHFTEEVNEVLEYTSWGDRVVWRSSLPGFVLCNSGWNMTTNFWAFVLQRSLPTTDGYFNTWRNRLTEKGFDWCWGDMDLNNRERFLAHLRARK